MIAARDIFHVRKYAAISSAASTTNITRTHQRLLGDVWPQVGPTNVEVTSSLGTP